jgi:hypothetical protein
MQQQTKQSEFFSNQNWKGEKHGTANIRVARWLGLFSDQNPNWVNFGGP